MGNLMGRTWKDGVILLDMCVHRGGVVCNTIDEFMVWRKCGSRYLLDCGGHGRGEEECLPLWHGGEVVFDVLDIIPEAHVKKRVCLIQNELDAIYSVSFHEFENKDGH